MNPSKPYGEGQSDLVGELYLKINHLTLQRDAFKAALETEVLKVMRASVIQATISTDNEVARLKAEVERLKEGNECLDQMHEKEMARSAFLCEQVERLTKAVMHSPAAQLKLKELEGKTTFDEINPKGGQP